MGVLFFYIAILFSSLAYSQAVTSSVPIPNPDQSENITPSIFSSFDDENEFTINEINQISWQDSKTDVIAAGLYSGTIWLKLTLKNPSKNFRNTFLVLENEVLDTATLFFSKSDGSWSKVKQGMNLGKEKIFTSFPAFEIKLRGDESKTYFIKTQSNFAFTLTTHLYGPMAFSSFVKNNSVTGSLSLGILVTCFVYSMILFLIIRTRASLAIATLILFCYIPGLEALSKTIGQFFDVTDYRSHMYMIFVARIIYPIGLAEFTIHLCQLKKGSIERRILMYCSVISLASIPFIFIIPLQVFNGLHNLLCLSPLAFAVLLTTIRGILGKNRRIVIFGIGWTPHLILVLLITTANLLELEIPLYLFSLFSVLQALIFTTAAADHIYQLKIERKQSDELHLEEVNQFNNKLSTALKKQRQKLDEATRNLMISSRKAGKSEVAANIIHSIGNIGTSLKVQTQVLMDEQQDYLEMGLNQLADSLQEGKLESLPADRMELIERYIREVSKSFHSERKRRVGSLEKIMNFISEIENLTESQKSLSEEKYSPQIFKLGDLCKTIVTDLDEDLKILDCSINIDCSDVELYTDAMRIFEVITSLLKNSIEALSNSKVKPTISILTQTAEDNIYIDITDNGPGIKPDQEVAIFKSGFSQKKHHHGYGLHNAANDCASIGGRLLLLESIPNKSTIFRILLPNKLLSKKYTEHIVKKKSSLGE